MEKTKDLNEIEIEIIDNTGKHKKQKDLVVFGL